ncbi:STAS domain-containing protein [Nocardia sp. CDC159]|uniref:Anti-sigma factor antagonist n=1 Tax=Nocardia pulmonis TaxID=2951408 RepID=A0A9X2E6U6_9NOCA|nr:MULTISPECIES: STAS domain-containing protein [Nocardia]MCM6775392.1 STAS domain-containing protein [Nocardia pulmonis]MCM6787874.1 STAS domain-containing protein [Nocardia sp. CDC159]
MTTPLEITVQHRDQAAVLAITGEIDMSNADRLRAALEAALLPDEQLVVDLTGVDYLDSSGLAVLLPQARRLRVLASAMLRKTLTVGGLTALTDVEFR